MNPMNKNRIFFCLAASMLAFTYTSKAAIAWSGNTCLISSGEQLTGVDNQVAIDTADLGPDMISAFVPGTGSSVFDSSAKYTVLYQLTGRGGGTEPIESLSQMTSQFTSFGYIPGWGMKDEGNWIGVTENMGADDFLVTGGIRQGGIASFGTKTGLISPESVSINGGYVCWDFGSTPLDQGYSSALLVLTGNRIINQPETIKGRMWDADGVNVAIVPEPSTWLAGLGVLGMFGLNCLRQRRFIK